MMALAMRKKRILIVDDEPAILQYCQRVLNEAGWDVDTAPDGISARAVISEREYDLYLFDIKMPGASGKELYIWLEKTYPDRAARVIFMTGSAVGQETESFLESSGRPVLLKPFTVEELEAIVTQTLKAVDK